MQIMTIDRVDQFEHDLALFRFPFEQSGSQARQEHKVCTRPQGAIARISLEQADEIFLPHRPRNAEHHGPMRLTQKRFDEPARRINIVGRWRGNSNARTKSVNATGARRWIRHQLPFALVARRCDNGIGGRDRPVLFGQPCTQGQVFVALRALVRTQRVRGINERNRMLFAHALGDLCGIGEMRMDDIGAVRGNCKVIEQSRQKRWTVTRQVFLCQVIRIAAVDPHDPQPGVDPFFGFGMDLAINRIGEAPGDDVDTRDVRVAR